jgi:hypothetical protein
MSFCVGMFSLLGIVLFSLLLEPALVDDGLIYLKVSRNIFEGYGWRYNVLEPSVNPCTSLLYTLLLVGLQYLSFSPQSASLVLYGVGVWGSSWAVFCLYREREKFIATVLALSYVVHQMFFLSVGLETSLFVALSLWSVLWWENSRRHWAVGSLALLLICRIDGIFLIGVLACSELRRRNYRSVCYLVVPVLALLSWFLFSHYYFGQVLPQSVVIKSLQSQYGLWQRKGPWIRGLLLSPPFPFITWPTLLYSFYLTYRSWTRAQALVITYSLVQVVAYAITDAPVRYPWYFALSSVVADILLVELFLKVEKDRRFIFKIQASERVGRVHKSERIYRGLLLFCVLKIAAILPPAVPVTYRYSGDYVETAHWLNQRAQPADRVATVEIGYFGYFYHGPILDIHGLIHMDATEKLRSVGLLWWYVQPFPQYVLVHSPGEWDGEPSYRWPIKVFNEFHQRYRKVFTTSSGLLDVYQLQMTY